LLVTLILLLAACAFALAGLIPAGLELWRFDKEARDFDPILEHIEAARTA